MEYAEVLALMEMRVDSGAIPQADLSQMIAEKKLKVEKFLAYSLI